MSLSDLLAQAHPLVSERLSPTEQPILFFSLCDGKERANTYRASGRNFHQAWKEGVALCQREVLRRKLTVTWLRIDWVLEIQETTWAGLLTRLNNTKRNYFRLGLSLDADLKMVFLEQEINANAMLYPGGNNPAAGLNLKNFTVRAKKRFGSDFKLDSSPERPVYLFTHEGLFLAQDPNLATLPGGKHPVWLPAPGKANVRWRAAESLNAGRRQIDTLQPEQVHALIESSSNFLARQVEANGRFIYGHFPCFGRLIPTYNSLRHASSVYAMLEGWEVTKNETLLEAIRRAISYLSGTLIRHYPQADGTKLAFNVDIGGEIKLGANAVSLLALVKYEQLTGDDQYRPLMEALALGIAHMQDPDTGKFVHVLNAEDLSVKDAFRIVYYDGEAAFGLMRLYGLTKDPRWLSIVEKAFDYFIQAEHWKHHDHWLSYCANELSLHKPQEKYFRFGVQNIAGYLDFILTRETTYPTLLELSMAFEAMLQRINTVHPEMRHVLKDLDVEKFHRALHHRAHYLLNGFFWPELAMFFAKPETVVGSFFIRHHSFRVRIDDIEHYLSGYVAYWKMLLKKGSGGPANAQEPTTEGGLNSESSGSETRIAANFDTVGVLMYPASPKGFREIQAYAEKASDQGLKVLYLSYRNPHMESGRVTGHLYQGGRWRPGQYALPTIIDNAPPRNAQERAWFDQLSGAAFMTCNKLGGKSITLPLLAANERTRPYAIPSTGLTLASLLQFLKEYGCAIVKPVRSNRGRNVFLLRNLRDGGVELASSDGVRLLDDAALKEFTRTRSESSWLIQRYVQSVDQKGHAFDVRVALFRADHGEWKVARAYARLGTNPVTSNLATGGTALDAREFLGTLYPALQADKLKEQLETAAHTIASVLQAHYPFVIDALGCDFGIADGKLYLFEVNSYPGIKGCLQAATDAKVAYHRSLLRAFEDSSRSSYSNDIEWAGELARVARE